MCWLDPRTLSQIDNAGANGGAVSSSKIGARRTALNAKKCIFLKARRIMVFMTNFEGDSALFFGYAEDVRMEISGSHGRWCHEQLSKAMSGTVMIVFLIWFAL